MIRLVHKGKMLSEKKTMKANNIEAEAPIEMSLRLLGGMEVNEQMGIPTKQEKTGRKRDSWRKEKKEKRHGLHEKRHNRST